MTLTEAIVSGAVQGLTEFLPISSSGHLVLVHGLFGSTEPGMFFDICLHAATLVAVLIYFGRDISGLVRQRRANWLFYIAIGTVPAVLAALLFEESIEAFFTDTGKVALMLIATGLVLFAGQAALWVRKGNGAGPNYKTSTSVGISQAFALLPGISRSGMTISAALLGGMRPAEAFRFSFLLSIPAVSGALLYKSLTTEALSEASGDLLNYVTGMSAALLTGLLSLRLLWWVMSKRKLYVFGIYCIALGTFCIFFCK